MQDVSYGHLFTECIHPTDVLFEVAVGVVWARKDGPLTQSLTGYTACSEAPLANNYCTDLLEID